MKTKIQNLFLSISIVLLQTTIAPLTIAYSDIQASCLDTIAGYSSLCKSSITVPNTEIIFKITKPNGSVVRFPCATDPEGNAKCDINFYHTQSAGAYAIGAYLSGYGEPSSLNETAFKVFPDQVSTTHSIIQSSKQSIAANNVDYGFITITLRDKYGNPIPEHTVELLSSRGEDTIEAIKNGISNNEGKVAFKISSKTSGISTYIARDIYTGSTLIERPKIVFYSGGSTLQTTSPLQQNSFLKTNILGAVGGPVQSLVLTTPDQVQVNTPFDVTVQAIDSTGNPATGYLGTIFFSTEDDPNAMLPLTNEGYTFTGRDENASHSFSKAVIFKTTGTKRLKVTDIDNTDLEGEKIITVVSGSINANTNSSSSITISSPTSGSTYSDSKIDLVGRLSPNTKYKIKDSDIEIGSDTSDKDGNFLFTAKGLSDGKHAFTIEAIDASDTVLGTSSEVIVFIDTQLPLLQSITISPEQILTNSSVQITISSEPKLTKAQIIINDIAHDAFEDTANPGTYKTIFNAPDQEGTYDVRVILTNALGKNTEAPTNKKITVIKGENKISGLKTSEGDKGGSVLLSWNALSSTSQFKEYTVYYDTNPITLQNKITSSESTPTAIISGLKTGTTYYFAVSITGKDGVEGPQSDIIPGTPKIAKNSLENIKLVGSDSRITLSWDDPGNSLITQYKISYGLRSQEYLEHVITKNNTPTWYIPDLINGKTYYFIISALDQSNTILFSTNELRGTAGNNQLHTSACIAGDVTNVRIVTRGTQKILVWDNVPGVSSYKVYASTQQGIFNLPPQEVSETFYVIPVFEEQHEYYFFAVKAICGDSSQESLNFSNILKIGTGPEALMLGILSFIAIGTGVIFRKKIFPTH